MLKCEGYQMFRGIATVNFDNGKSQTLEGTWMWHPEKRMWFLNGCKNYPYGTSFYPENVVIPTDA
jgi:hypothetical protein